MASDSFEVLLERAASWFGIDGCFWDIFGNRHTTSVAAKQSILRALGVAADSASDLERALAALARHEWERLVAPAGGGGEADHGELPLRKPGGRAGAPGRLFVCARGCARGRV